MSVEDCGNVEFLFWSYFVFFLNSEQEDFSDLVFKIVFLFLVKLVDYVVLGCQIVFFLIVFEFDIILIKISFKNFLKGDKDFGEESEVVDGKFLIFIYKWEDQLFYEVFQLLLSSLEG